jgi:succinoglycan biosynthesis transport protein ExoP
MNNLEESFRILRASLEAKFSGSAMFTVTSADRNDGAVYVATGIARAFAEAGEPTLLVSAAREDASLESAAGQQIRGEGTPLGSTVHDAELPMLQIVTPSTSSEVYNSRNLRSIVSDLRDKFRVIVVAVDPLQGSASAHEYARESDGILLAVRLGRSPQSADQELLRALSVCGTETIGVVPTRNSGRTKALASKKPTVFPEYGVTPLRKPREAKAAS